MSLNIPTERHAPQHIVIWFSPFQIQVTPYIFLDIHIDTQNMIHISNSPKLRLKELL